LQRDTECLGYADYRRESKIFSPCFEVSDKGSVQFAIVCEFFLGFEASLNPDFPDTSSELAQGVFHSPECLGSTTESATDLSVAY